jgi:hypothetical protein
MHNTKQQQFSVILVSYAQSTTITPQARQQGILHHTADKKTGSSNAAANPCKKTKAAFAGTLHARPPQVLPGTQEKQA